jgi:alpha-D-ribose 1-methylphosphonate 5-triphosphate diphosphatase
LTHKSFIVEHAHIVTPEQVLLDSTLTVENGIIASIGKSRGNLPVVSGNGGYLLPGFIDMHSDAIEKEVEPRPGSLLPLEIAISELDRKLAASGITTIFHSLSFNDKKLEVLRTTEMVDSVIRKICSLRPHLLVNTHIHARYEITSSDTFEILRQLVESGTVDLVSIMDHTPGQGQFATAKKFSDYYGPRYAEHQDKIDQVMNNLTSVCNSVRTANAQAAAELCRRHRIPLASHDDDTVDKIHYIHGFGAVISEFPITLNAGLEARRRGLAVAVGSPNIVRGGSHNGNLSASDLIRNNIATIVCSDYIPSTMLHAAFHLLNTGIITMVDIASLFAANAASALGLDSTTGSIRQGLAADLVLVNTTLPYPRVAKTFVSGREVYSACLH